MRTTQEVAYRWALHNEQRKMNTGKAPKCRGRYGNTSYEGRDYFSYSTRVAAYHEGKHGLYVVFATKHWSLTTNRHIKHAKYWIDVPIFEVPCLSGTEVDINLNVEYLCRQLRVFQIDAIEKWKTWAYSDANVTHKLLQLYMTLMNYCAVTGVAHDMPPLEEMQEHIFAERNRRKNIFHDPKAVAKRERARARRLANAIFATGD
jgi:hypothetical protein